MAALVGLRRRGGYLVHDRHERKTWDAVSFFATQRRGPLYLMDTNARTTAEISRTASENGWRVLYVLPETIETPDPSATLSTDGGARYVISSLRERTL